MFRPIALFIGLRYTRAKRRNHFISFISLTSMLGIALGVAVLITVLSVMNGFDEAIRSRILGMARHVSISSFNGALTDWQNIEHQVTQVSGVIGVAPYVDGQGMLVNAGQVRPVLVTGILPKAETAVSILQDHIIAGSLNTLKPGQFGIVLGVNLAESLGISLGDHITLLTPAATPTPAGFMPRFKTFKVVALFKVGNGFGFDSNLAFMQLNDAQKLFQLDNSVSGLRLKISDFYQATAISHQLMKNLPSGTLITNWTQDYGGFFAALKLEKTMMFLMLVLIIAVAAFNLVSTLVMVVTDKKSDIAILRTLGATPRMILATFIVQGSLVGILGTTLGLLGGIFLATHATSLVSGIEHYFHVQLISSDVYYVNYLPSKLVGHDVTQVCLLSLILSLLATLYPAWRAARVQPAEALRYE